MAIFKWILLLILITFFFSIACVGADVPSDDDDLGEDAPVDEEDVGPVDDFSFNRTVFPANFTFGTAGSAYQYEGAANASGKAQSVWDNFTATYTGGKNRIKDNSSGLIADDTYHRYKNDTEIMKCIGLDAYRFSISWTRILPYGKVSRAVDEDGIAYYNSLIDDLLSKGIEPYATIFHFDLPQALQDEYGGFLDDQIIDDFVAYAELCFTRFGDRVKNWITINEPWSYSVMGYAAGLFPPNRCSEKGGITRGIGFSVGRFGQYADYNCAGGDSGTEPYEVSHRLILAHASAVKLYRDKYQKKQNGRIGISLCTEWYEPYDNTSEADKEAASRGLAFTYGWFMEPLHSGSYPIQMIKNVGNRLPSFMANQSELVKGSFDFIGLNYYTGTFVKDVPCENSTKGSYLTDPCTEPSTTNVHNKSIGPKAGSDWLRIYPKGIRQTLELGKNNYSNPLIIVTENGVDRRNLGWNRKNDTMRTRYLRSHLKKIKNAIDIDDVSVGGYFVWSLFDNFEWLDGYTQRFGLVYIEYNNETLTREYKASSSWFQNFLLATNVTKPECPIPVD